MIHPYTELRFIDETMGYGVFATREIPKGTVVWTLCNLDRVYTPQEVAKLPATYHPIIEKYTYLHSEGNFILCWDNGRFINHSCDPNILDIGDCEIAIRDIKKNEQITCEYSLLNLWESMPCNCGAANCRKVVHPEDISRLYQPWDQTANSTLPFLSKVSQPLYDFIIDKRKFDAMRDGTSAAPSHLTLICSNRNDLKGFLKPPVVC